MSNDSITSFSGEFAFLSNFYPVDIKWEGKVYPSVEHAYQAGKFPPGELREKFGSHQQQEKPKPLVRKEPLTRIKKSSI